MVVYGTSKSKTLSKKLRRWTLEDHSTQSRKAYITRLQNWLKRLISNYRESTNELMQKFGTTLENAASEMFTFVMYSHVHSTTNLCEQSIRKMIGHRNSRIQLKSDRGAENFCIMLSCVETWKLRKLNVWDELCRVIGPAPASDN
ncbi:MAG: transposase [Cenarchaeum sp. SB0665_bin_23]|nr:transposase [Cenarchaeum sp. SB0665_bin_23]